LLGVSLLGCGGMTPLPERRLTSLLVRHSGKMILVDCGEGTQIGIKKLGWGFKSIDAVCITHYHADHVAGLPGFLLTLGNSDRREPLTILGPPPLEYIISSLTVIAPHLPYGINLAELSTKAESSVYIGELNVKVMPMEHRIPCLAYSFELSRSGRFDVAAAKALNIPMKFWNPLQKGKTIEFEGRTLVPELVVGPPREGLKVTYSTDCRPTDALLELCRNSDLLVCEGMYADDELIEKAKERKHMIFSEAANLALHSGSKELWLTHFSPSLNNPQDYISIPQSIFPNTVIGRELLTKELNFRDK